MNKFLLTLLCGGSLMTLSGCGKEESKTTDVTTEVAVADATPVAVETQVVEIKKDKDQATEVAVTDAVVIEKSVEVTEVPKQDDKF